MTCQPCDAAREYIRALDALRETGLASRATRVEKDRFNTAHWAWDAAQHQPHTCYRSPKEATA